MLENSMQKVRVSSKSDRSGYIPSTPTDYKLPVPVKVPPPPAKQGK